MLCASYYQFKKSNIKVNMTKNFSEDLFPTDISYGMEGGPEFFTEIITLNNGSEQRNINWCQPRSKFNVAHGVKTKEQLNRLIAFFRTKQGKAIGFRFKDWTDFQAKNQIIDIGDGKKKVFQLIKTYETSSISTTRIINKPVKDKVKIFVQNQQVEAQINYENGRIILKNCPKINEIISADFEFDIAVRFDTDKLSALIDTYGSYSWNEIPLLEIKL